MNLLEIADYVWKHSHAFSFGQSPTWDHALFTKSWAEERKLAKRWSAYGPGWYWFLVKHQPEDFLAAARPESLPKSGCDIGKVAKRNYEIFSANRLCQPMNNGKTVVYNGHEASVSSRVRAHFSLNNERTGAIGLRHFLLSHHDWEVRLFSEPCFPDGSNEEKKAIAPLMNSKSGRCAVESSWRASNGWPVLCKA